MCWEGLHNNHFCFCHLFKEQCLAQNFQDIRTRANIYAFPQFGANKNVTNCLPIWCMALKEVTCKHSEKGHCVSQKLLLFTREVEQTNWFKDIRHFFSLLCLKTESNKKDPEQNCRNKIAKDLLFLCIYQLVLMTLDH